MTALDQTILFTMLGALIGATLSPCMDIVFRKWSKTEGEVHSIQNGLALLASANAFWVLVFLLGTFSLTQNSDAVSPLVFLGIYAVSTVFFGFAVFQFYKAKEKPELKILSTPLIFLALGNVLWLISDASEIFGYGTKLQQSLLALGATALFIPLVLVLWRRYA